MQDDDDLEKFEAMRNKRLSELKNIKLDRRFSKSLIDKSLRHLPSFSANNDDAQEEIEREEEHSEEYEQSFMSFRPILKLSHGESP